MAAARSASRLSRHRAGRAPALLALLLLAASMPAAAGVVVHVFTREGCPHCERALAALEHLAAERPAVEVHRYDIARDAAQRLRLVEAARALGVEVGGVPFTVIGTRSWVGYLDDATTGAAFAAQIEACLARPCADPLAAGSESASGSPASPLPAFEPPASFHLPLLGEVSTARLSLPALTVLLAAIDGFNPCAMWVLVFLLGILAGLKDRRRMWLLGGGFLIASAGVYLLILGAWLELFLWLGALPFVRYAMGGVAAAAGIHYLRDFVTNPAGACEVTSSPTRRRALAGLKRLVLAPGSLLAFAGVVLLAVAVNAVELLCSAGVPAIFTHVLAQAELSPSSHLGYLLLYVAVFLLDDLCVLVLALKTLELTGLAGVHGRWSSLLGAVLLFGIAGVLLLRPTLFGMG